MKKTFLSFSVFLLCLNLGACSWLYKEPQLEPPIQDLGGETPSAQASTSQIVSELERHQNALIILNQRQQNLKERVEILELEALSRGVKLPTPSSATPNAQSTNNHATSQAQQQNAAQTSPTPAAALAPSASFRLAGNTPDPATLPIPGPYTKPVPIIPNSGTHTPPQGHAPQGQVPQATESAQPQSALSAVLQQPLIGSSPIEPITAPGGTGTNPAIAGTPSAPVAPINTAPKTVADAVNHPDFQRVGPSENAQYDAALQQYRSGRFSQAEQAFQSFLEKYPSSSLTPNALYWKGETYYSRGEYPNAIFTFKDIQARFPKHGKTPDSLLKTAMAYSKLGDKANADLHLQVLVEDWPKSEAVRRAKSMNLIP